jgi:hypothetical protein
MDYVAALGRAGCHMICNDWLLKLLEQRRQIDRKVIVFKGLDACGANSFYTRVAKDCVLLPMQAVEWQGG